MPHKSCAGWATTCCPNGVFNCKTGCFADDFLIAKLPKGSALRTKNSLKYNTKDLNSYGKKGILHIIPKVVYIFPKI